MNGRRDAQRLRGALPWLACIAGSAACGGAAAPSERPPLEGGVAIGPDADIEVDGAPDAGGGPPSGGPAGPTADLSFAAAGLRGGPLSWIPLGVAASGDGRILVAGEANDGTYPASEIVRRYTSAGDLDPSFGTSGEVRVAVAPSPLPQSVRVFGDGTVAVFGASTLGGGASSFALRLRADGSLDMTFGDAGAWTSNVTGRGTVGVFLGGGSLVAAGEKATVELSPAGAIVPTFGGGALPGAVAAAAGSDGSLVFTDGASITRYAPSGDPDPTFGASGAVPVALVLAPPSADAGVPVARALFVAPSGAIVVAGGDDRGGQPFVDVTRVTAAGAADPSFADGGVLSAPAGDTEGALELADGRPIAWTIDGDLVVVHPAAGGDAGAPIDVVDLGVLGPILGATVDGAGRLLVVGSTTLTQTPSWFLRRYTLDP